MTVTYILWVVLECIIFSVMVASICESSGGARHETMKIDALNAEHSFRTCFC